MRDRLSPRRGEFLIDRVVGVQSPTGKFRLSRGAEPDGAANLWQREVSAVIGELHQRREAGDQGSVGSMQDGSRVNLLVSVRFSTPLS